MFRRRIRITLIGDNIYEPPVELHDQQLQHPEYRFMDCLQELQHQSNLLKDTSRNKRVLPVRALNEVNFKNISENFFLYIKSVYFVYKF